MDYLIREKVINLFLDIDNNYSSKIIKKYSICYAHTYKLAQAMEGAGLLRSEIVGRKKIYHHTRKGKEVAILFRKIIGVFKWADG